jgi:penicillin-binding protein 1A
MNFTNSTFKIIGLLILSFFIFLGVLVLVFFLYLKVSLPSIAKLKNYQPKQTNLIVDYQDRVVGYLGEERRIYVPINKIPPHVIKAFLAAEDANFYKHRGIDFFSLMRAFVKNIISGKIVQGGSTITQQVAKSLLLTPERTLSRKIKEMFLAWQIEKHLTKDEILNIYLNHIYLGEGAYGVEAASLTYFGKHVWELSIPEAAVLAGLPPSPVRYSPLNNPTLALERRNYVLRRMAEVGFITEDQLNRYLKEPLLLNPKNVNIPAYAGYFIDVVKAELESVLPKERLEQGGLRIKLTMNVDWQRVGYLNLVNKLKQLYPKGNPPEVSAVCLDNRDGGVRFLTGGKDYLYSTYNRAVLGKRQPGSAFKPFIWAQALETGVVSQDAVIPDEPITLPGANAGEDWSPGNYDGKYLGPVSLKQAVAQSRNTVSVRLALMLGTDRLVDLVRKMEFKFPMPINLSIALGTYELTPLELTTAYTIFPTLGNKLKPRFIEAIYDQIYGGKLIYQSQQESKPAFSPQTMSIMNDFLQEVVRSGTGRCALALGLPVGSKTGTTQEYRDAWFIGFTADSTCGVWVGYDKGATLGKGETGGKIACPLWVSLMQGIKHEAKPLPVYIPPADVLSNSTTGDTSGAN